MIDKRKWIEKLTLERRDLLKVFFAGALVATVVWFLVFFIYLQTGFIGI